MVTFAGYSKQPDPKWPYIVITVLIIVLFVGLSSLIAWINHFISTIPKNENTKVSSQVPKAPLPANLIVSLKETEETNSKIVIVQNEGITVESIVFSNSINSQNQPGNDIVKISKQNNLRLYCYTKIITDKQPQTLRHVWIDPSFNLYADIKIDALNKPANIWSYITLYDKPEGLWEFQLKTLEGNIISKKSILIEK